MSLKESIKKSIAAFMAVSLISSNCYLCGLGLRNVIAEEAKEPDIVMNMQNLKYVQYQGEEYSGVAVQTSLEIGTNQEQDNYIPVKSANVLLSFPTLNGYLPTKANVVTSSTYLTTGKLNNKNINQNYDSSSGLLAVSYENNEMYSNYMKDAKDKFEIIYIYPAEAYMGNEEEIDLEYRVETTMEFATENSVTTAQKEQNFIISEKENNI